MLKFVLTAFVVALAGMLSMSTANADHQCRTFEHIAGITAGIVCPPGVYPQPPVVYREVRPIQRVERFRFEYYSGPAYMAPRYRYSDQNQRNWNNYYRHRSRNAYPNNPAPGVHRVGPTHYRVNGALVSTRSAGCGDRMINVPGVGLGFICN